MWLKRTTGLAVAGIVLVAARAGAAEVRPGQVGEMSSQLDEARLSLVPLTNPVPDMLVLGTRPAEGPTAAELRGIMDLSLPPVELSGLEILGKVFDAQDVYWPLGTAQTVHVQMPLDDAIGKWQPFVSLLQDADELDAHLRNGIGAGVTYRFSKDARVDIEAQYLEKSGDANPAIGSEARVSVVFSFGF